MTYKNQSAINMLMARPKQDLIAMPGRYLRGTRERIKAVLKPGEKQAEFLRLAVEKEIRLRELRSRRRLPNTPS